MSYQEDKMANRILKYWPLIIGAVAIIGGWVNFTNVDANNSEKIKALQKENLNTQAIVEQVKASNNQMLVQLSQIQTDLAWIKKNLR